MYNRDKSDTWRSCRLRTLLSLELVNQKCRTWRKSETQPLRRFSERKEARRDGSQTSMPLSAASREPRRLLRQCAFRRRVPHQPGLEGLSREHRQDGDVAKRDGADSGFDRDH